MNKKIGIIGDVHAEHERLELALNWLNKECVDVVICTGDVADGLGDIDVACDLLASNNVLTVAGNHDRWLLTDTVRHVENAHSKTTVRDSTLQFLFNLPKTLRIPTIDGELLLCHGVIEDDLAKIWPGTATTDPKRSTALDEMLSQSINVPRFVINGHMHFRTLIDFANCQLINAGTLKGLHSGVSILDLDAHTLCGYDLCAENHFLPAQSHFLKECGQRRVWRNTQEFDSQWQPVILHCPL